MKTKNVPSVFMVVLVFLGTLAPLSFAHQVRRYSPSHKPAWRYVAHTHEKDASMKVEQKDEGKAKEVEKEAQKEVQKETQRPHLRENRTGFRFGMPGQK